MQLRTDRLCLRGWPARDRGPFAELDADPEVTGMSHYRAPAAR